MRWQGVATQNSLDVGFKDGDAAAQLGKPHAAHTWLRYSTFLLLYPIGVFGECLLYAAARAGLYAAGPVAMGVPLTYGHLLDWFVLPAYVPGLPLLYLHMLAQRAKVLGKARAKGGKSQ